MPLLSCSSQEEPQQWALYLESKQRPSHPESGAQGVGHSCLLKPPSYSLLQGKHGQLISHVLQPELLIQEGDVKCPFPDNMSQPGCHHKDITSAQGESPTATCEPRVGQIHTAAPPSLDPLFSLHLPAFYRATPKSEGLSRKPTPDNPKLQTDNVQQARSSPRACWPTQGGEVLPPRAGVYGRPYHSFAHSLMDKVTENW